MLEEATLAVAAALGIAGCSDRDTTAACVTDVTTQCQPLYPPTYDQVFNRTLSTTCAQPGGVCHASAGVQGGLLFVDADQSYAMLLGEQGGDARVLPGNPACSILVERVASTDASTVMPPKAPLSAAETCAIVQWINNGAKR